MWTPPVTVAETPDELLFTAELPGLSEEHVSIELENDVLTISGEKSEERTEGDEERNYHLWERSYGSFRRSFSLPRAVDVNAGDRPLRQGRARDPAPEGPRGQGPQDRDLEELAGRRDPWSWMAGPGGEPGPAFLRGDLLRRGGGASGRPQHPGQLLQQLPPVRPPDGSRRDF
jgi:hypothetical protein